MLTNLIHKHLNNKINIAFDTKADLNKTSIQWTTGLNNFDLYKIEVLPGNLGLSLEDPLISKKVRKSKNCF